MTLAQIVQYPQEKEAPEAVTAPLITVVLRRVTQRAYDGEVPVRPTLPDEILIGSLLDANLRVCEPIAVKLASEGGQIAAHAVDLDEFGYGDTVLEAITDLQHTVAELFSELERSKDRLGPDLQRVWRTLSAQVTRLP